jgi:glutaminase
MRHLYPPVLGGINAQDLAMMAATLANGGTNPTTGKQLLSVEKFPRFWR